MLHTGNSGELDSDQDALPRFDSGIEKPEVEPTELHWTVEKSMFKEIIMTKETYDKCIGSDFLNSRIDRMIKLESMQEAVKADVRQFYPELVETYKYFATISYKESNVFINYNELYKFLTDTGVIDEVTLRKVDYDVIFKATMYKAKGKD
jgi:hypothetical protein